MIEIKQGDRVPVELTVNHDLSAATVDGVVKHLTRSADAEALPVTVTDAEHGVVRFDLDGTWERGDHYLELKITQGAERRTAPGVGVFVVRITPALIAPVP